MFSLQVIQDPCKASLFWRMGAFDSSNTVTYKRAVIMVKESLIHGKGVFAAVAFKKGQKVISWDNSRYISQSEYENLDSNERRYVDFQDGKILYIGEPERFVNHSCSHNTVPGELCEIAIRDIEIGEEITANYDYFFIRNSPIKCTCGSSSCRREIFGKSVQKGAT